MKYLKIIILHLILTSTNNLVAQEVNWRNLNEKTKHLVSASFGADYSSYYGVSYGHMLNARKKPIVIGAEFTVPFGKDILDDWKIKLAAQLELWHSENFSFSLKPAFIVRRYASEIATLYNIAADLTLILDI
jgi:hypothetical protein